MDDYLFEVKIPENWILGHLNVRERLNHYAKEIGKVIDPTLSFERSSLEFVDMIYWYSRMENICEGDWNITVTSLKPENRDPGFITFQIDHLYKRSAPPIYPEKMLRFKEKVLQALNVKAWNQE